MHRDDAWTDRTEAHRDKKLLLLLGLALLDLKRSGEPEGKSERRCRSVAAKTL